MLLTEAQRRARIFEKYMNQRDVMQRRADFIQQYALARACVLPQADLDQDRIAKEGETLWMKANSGLIDAFVWKVLSLEQP